MKTPPVDIYLVEVWERHESAITLCATVDPYEAFAVAEAAVSRADASSGRANDLDGVEVTRSRGSITTSWQRVRARLGEFRWWEDHRREDAARVLSLGRGPWSPWVLVGGPPSADDEGTLGVAHHGRRYVHHGYLLRSIGSRQEILITASERLAMLSQESPGELDIDWGYL